MAGLLCNVGPIERVVRLLLAGASAVPVLSGRQPQSFRRSMAALAGAELLSAYTRFCPASAALGINHCRREGILGAVAKRATSALPGTGHGRGASSDASSLVGRHWDGEEEDDSDDSASAVVVGLGALAMGAGVAYLLNTGRGPAVARTAVGATAQAAGRAGETMGQAVASVKGQA